MIFCTHLHNFTLHVNWSFYTYTHNTKSLLQVVYGLVEQIWKPYNQTNNIGFHIHLCFCEKLLKKKKKKKKFQTVKKSTLYILNPKKGLIQQLHGQK